MLIFVRVLAGGDFSLFLVLTMTSISWQGFFGAAPFMLTNPHWIAILRILMPDVYVEISRRASYAPAPRLIHWAEK